MQYRYGLSTGTRRWLSSFHQVLTQNTSAVVFDVAIIHALCFLLQNLPTYELKDPQNRKISFFIEVLWEGF